eukprot:TRINITY_DN44596_c0_g2_i1.p1 TRINITY_DN44596_c0_g2~~TRINITY_DN44596_c0_g2_i1.p1  ORF type:complete len:984 (+),score=239.12 TRINITY_DN44596_c0_g2_i1:79-3030(+)
MLGLLAAPKQAKGPGKPNLLVSTSATSSNAGDKPTALPLGRMDSFECMSPLSPHHMRDLGSSTSSPTHHWPHRRGVPELLNQVLAEHEKLQAEHALLYRRLRGFMASKQQSNGEANGHCHSDVPEERPTTRRRSHHEPLKLSSVWLQALHSNAYNDLQFSAEAVDAASVAGSDIGGRPRARSRESSVYFKDECGLLSPRLGLSRRSSRNDGHGGASPHLAAAEAKRQFGLALARYRDDDDGACSPASRQATRESRREGGSEELRRGRISLRSVTLPRGHSNSDISRPQSPCSSNHGDTLPENTDDLRSLFSNRSEGFWKDKIRSPDEYADQSNWQEEVRSTESRRIIGRPSTHDDDDDYANEPLSAVSTNFEKQDFARMRQKMRDLYDELTKEEDESLSISELRKAFLMTGMRQNLAMKLLRLADKNGDGDVDREEWSELVESLEVVRGGLDCLVDCTTCLDNWHRDHPGSKIGEKAAQSESRCIMKEDGTPRVMWDAFVGLLLSWLAVVLPMTMAFEANELPQFIAGMDAAVDFGFLVDIGLNFRTSFRRNEEEVTGAKEVALHYVRTWFLLDVCSSVPVELITMISPGLSSLRMLKMFRIAKLLKVFRLARFDNYKPLQQLYEEVSVSATFRLTCSLGVMLFLMALFTHWLACCMVASGPGYLDGYQDLGTASVSRQYLAGFYWAMMTITTVGYGDILPSSDAERVYCVMAMLIGSSFNAYVIGRVSVILASKDLNLQTYYQRVDLVNAWLSHHELPTSVRARVRRYFKKSLKHKSAISAAAVLQELPPQLREEVAHCLVHFEVRYNSLFENVPETVLAQLCDLLEKVTADAGELIINSGSEGMAMYVVLHGTARVLREECATKRVLHPGESFGEEIILQLASHYDYSVTAVSELDMLKISAEGFIERFEGMDDIMGILMENFRAQPNKWVPDSAPVDGDGATASQTSGGRPTVKLARSASALSRKSTAVQGSLFDGGALS